MENFDITTRGGRTFTVKPFLYQTKVNYFVEIDGYEVTYTGNPKIGGAFLIPEDAPDALDLHLLEDIARAIESHFL